MNRRQILVLSLCLLVVVVLWILPRTREAEATNTEMARQPAADAEFASQLESVKKETDPGILAHIEFFEAKLKSNPGKAGVPWLDSLSRTWDSQMRPGIAAAYVFQKAELLQTAEAWKEAGIRYLGLSRFFEGENQSSLAQRAISCLEKARELAPSDRDVKTQLGVAYVEGSAEPMKGITLLREAVAEDSTNVDAQLSLGFFSMRSGQYDKAVKRFRTVKRLRSDLPEIKLYLADALQMLGDKAAALRELDELEKVSTDSILLQEAAARRQQLKN